MICKATQRNYMQTHTMQWLKSYNDVVELIQCNDMQAGQPIPGCLTNAQKM